MSFSVEAYDVMLTVLGAAFLAAAVVPTMLRGSPVSLPLVYLAVGIVLGVAWTGAPRFDPVANVVVAERLSELAVIVSLTSAGLKLDRRIGLRRWRSTWRLLAIAMPLSIVALAVAGVSFLGLSLAAAILLGAVLAPTDPVLASSVQVGPPGSGDRDDVRFALTSEAGLNDGLAFPFVNLALVVAVSGVAGHALGAWVAVDVVWKIAAGVAVGLGAGRAIGWLAFRFCRADAVTDGFVALSLTLLTYGLTELVNGYGFIAVFVAALVFRDIERDHSYHRALHDMSEQAETLLMASLLLAFGVAIGQGLLGPLTWAGAAVGIAFVVVVRPLAGLTALIGTRLSAPQRGLIAAYGIRGIGTFYYLAHGLAAGAFDPSTARSLWALAGFIVLVSLLVHGLSAERALRTVARREPNLDRADG